MMHILIPVDGSEPSFRAVEFAAKLAAGNGSKLTILAVRQYIVGRHMTAGVWSQEEVDRILAKAKILLTTVGMMHFITAEINSRDVAHAIVNYAEEHDVGLIVMGASGMGNVKAFVIGSISAEVLRKSICPVTIVH